MPAINYPQSVSGFYLENLPEGLSQLFIPQIQIPMSLEVLQSFAARLDIPNAIRSHDSTLAMADFAEQLDQAIRRNEDGSFVRLGSRSPKDVHGISHKITNAKAALKLLCDSERIHADVHWCFLHAYPPTIFVRPWLEIASWREFRCFVREGSLEGISQYFTIDRPEFSEITQAAQEICESLTNFVRAQILSYAEHNDFVCDVLYDTSGSQIIDYNPLASSTGRCYFDDSFSKPAGPEMRFTRQGKVQVIPLPKEIEA